MFFFFVFHMLTDAALEFVRKQSFLSQKTVWMSNFTIRGCDSFSQDLSSRPRYIKTEARIVLIKLGDELQSFYVSFVCIHLLRPVQYVKFPGHFLKPAHLRKKQMYQLNIIVIKILADLRQTSYKHDRGVEPRYTEKQLQLSGPSNKWRQALVDKRGRGERPCERGWRSA